MSLLVHTQLAHAVVDSGAVDYLTPLIQHPDAKLKRNVGAALAQIAKHTAELADALVQAELFPSVCSHSTAVPTRMSLWGAGGHSVCLCGWLILYTVICVVAGVHESFPARYWLA
jgi:hypothetical protein